MPDFRERYKRLGFGRENVLVGRAIRSQRQNEERRERRSQLFGVHRDQNQCSDKLEEANSKEDTASSSKQRDDTAKTNDEESTKQHAIAKWRKERYRRKLVEKKVSKPPFKVGIVHHRLYSPPLSKNPNPSPPARLCKLKENQLAPVPVKTVTKATQNRRAAKSLESKQKAEAKKLKKSQEILKVSLVPNDHEFKAPEGVNAIPLFGRRALEAAEQSVLKTCPSTDANFSIASFISEEGNSLTPNNTSTPISAPAACLSPLMFCGNNKDIARKELEEALNNSSENNFLQIDFLKNPFREPTPGQSQTESPTKLSTHEDETKTLTPKNTTEPNPPSASLSSFMVCNSGNDNVREELQKPIAKLFGTNFLQMDSSKNLIHEFVHPENDFRKARASPKKLPHDEPAHALAEQTPLSSQPFKRLSPFKAASSDGDDTHKERLGTEKNYVKIDFSKNLFYEFVNIHPENSLSNEAHASPKKLSNEEATNTLVEESESLPTPLFNHLSPITDPSNDEGGGTSEQLQRSQEKYVQTDFSKGEENTTQYYRYLLNKETERLNGLCDSWDLVKKAISTPEDIQYLIQAAIGQTQLLIGKKFKRFGGLVQDCETGEGEMPVTCKDLLGFWELMYIEVEDCNGRFSKLEELKANGWIDKAAEQFKQKPAVKKAAVAKKKVPLVRSSSLKAHIVAARKKMQNDREIVAMKSAPEIVIQDIDDLAVPVPGDPAEVQGKALNKKNQEMRNNEEILSSSDLRIPKIEINDVCVQGKDENSNVFPSNAPTSQVSTPVNKLVLRKMHLSSKSPLIALKISKMCKTPEMSYVNTKGNAFERVSPRKSISPAKEDTSGVKSSKLKGKFLEFSPQKDDTHSSFTPRLTPQRRSLRIQKLNESKNHKNQDA